MTYRASFTRTLERTAEWRRECSVRYPADAQRNLEAAEILESLSSQFDAGDYDQELMTRCLALSGDESTTYDLTEAEHDVIGRIGFHEFPKTPDDLLNSILTSLERQAA